MRKLILSTSVAALLGTAAFAGGLPEPSPTDVVVATDTSSSKGGLVVPLLLLVLIAALASNSGGGNGDTASTSDRRIKTDVEWVGMARGLPVYRYRYIGSAARFEGVMAQDVLGMQPDAVITQPNGMLMVDYAKLGMRLKVVH